MGAHRLLLLLAALLIWFLPVTGLSADEERPAEASAQSTEDGTETQIGIGLFIDPDG